MDLELMGRTRRVGLACRCIREEDDRRREAEKQADIERRIASFDKYSLLDEESSRRNLETWDSTLDTDSYMKTFVENYILNWAQAKKQNAGIMFTGSVGRGKTYAASVIANEIKARYNEPVIFVGATGILQRIKETYNTNKEAEINLIRALSSAPLLVIDDLGTEKKSDWAIATIYQIIDARYRSRKPTIVTTNLTLQELRGYLQSSDGVERTYDRLREMCQPYKVKGEKSIRDVKAELNTGFLRSLLKAVKGE